MGAAPKPKALDVAQIILATPEGLTYIDQEIMFDEEKDYWKLLLEYRDRLFDNRKKNPTAEEITENVKPEHLKYFKDASKVIRMFRTGKNKCSVL